MRFESRVFVTFFISFTFFAFWISSDSGASGGVFEGGFGGGRGYVMREIIT